MSTLVIEGLRAGIEGREILRGIDLTVEGGEVHAVMGPNGSGKSTLSHVLMGRPGYEVIDGSVTIDGVEILGLSPWERAQAGLFLAMQYPVEITGVRLADVIRESTLAAGGDVDDALARLTAEAAGLSMPDAHLNRGINDDLSGGEKKRAETVQLAVLRPRFAILDELDSGLDVDGLRSVSRRVEQATNEDGLGVIAITHYSRLLRELRPDIVHVFVDGRIQQTGGPELAEELEDSGYDRWMKPIESAVSIGIGGTKAAADADPFADPLV